MKKYIQILLASTLLSIVFTSCNNNTYLIDDESYEKYVYLLGSGEYNVFEVEYEYGGGDDNIGYVPIHCSGSIPIDKDVEVVLELDPDLVEYYNKREFDIVTSRYAHSLESSRFNFDKMNLTLKVGDKNPYALLPIQVNVDGLSPDSIYFIPLKIASISAYNISEEKSEALFRVHMKNKYATSAKNVVYKLTSKKEDLVSGEVLFVNGQKVIKPIAKNIVRIYPETFSPSSSTELADIENNGILLTINEDNTIDITPYKNMDVIQNPDFVSKYDPQEKEFVVFYKYFDTTRSKYYEMHEVFSLFE